MFAWNHRSLSPAMAGAGADNTLVSDEEELILEPAVLPPKKSRRWRLAAGAFLCSSAVAALVVSSMRTRLAPTVAGQTGGETTLAEVKCGSPTQNCAASKCCVAGGKKGLQCYQKNAGWSECMELGSCKPGVHKGEKHGAYNQWGHFQLDKWSCKALGSHSKPGCVSYKRESECPAQQCSWKTGECVSPCHTQGAPDTCWKHKHCMWSGKCQEGCWLFKDTKTCSSHSRCMWSGGKCKIACKVHTSVKDCPSKDKCMWKAGKCLEDPCSAPGEDCSSTKCCSAARGSAGMTCFSKDNSFATCSTTCAKGVHADDKAGGKWSCGKLGNRTKLSPGCSWAGKDCSTTKLCCNIGFSCATKDKYFAGCTQTVKKSTWFSKKIPIPGGWSGKVLGYGRTEYQVGPAGKGQPVSGMSFYCFMAILPKSNEVNLMNVAKKNMVGIFSCNASDVFHSWSSNAAGWDTGEATLVNTDVFRDVWNHVRDSGKYLHYDWTVKADADCVFFVDRLRGHLWGLRPPAYRALYIKNNGMDPGLGNNGFLGAIEVFSQPAVQLYFDNQDGCKVSLGNNAGEDGFFKACMDALGVGFMWDKQMFFPDRAAGGCHAGYRAAFHPLKDPNEWQHCVDIALGKVPY